MVKMEFHLKKRGFQWAQTYLDLGLYQVGSIRVSSLWPGSDLGSRVCVVPETGLGPFSPYWDQTRAEVRNA